MGLMIESECVGGKMNAPSLMRSPTPASAAQRNRVSNAEITDYSAGKPGADASLGHLRELLRDQFARLPHPAKTMRQQRTSPIVTLSSQSPLRFALPILAHPMHFPD